MSTEEEKVSTEPAPEKVESTEVPVEKPEEVAPPSDVAEEKPESVATEKKEDKETGAAVEPGDEEEERFGTPEEGEREGAREEGEGEKVEEGGEGEEGAVEGGKEVKEGEAEGEEREEGDEGAEGVVEEEEGDTEGAPEDLEGGVDQLTLDDDQDIESPAYIPKTGKFYMHDSREDTAAAEEQREERRTRADVGMWARDRFDERYQQPRPRQHLIQKYGYDIRLGETKEMADEKEKELRESGVDVETEEGEEPTRGGHRRGTSANRGRGQWRPPRRHDGPHGRHAFNREADQEEFPALGSAGGNQPTDDDYVAPAARRDARPDRGSSYRGGEGQGGYGRSGDVRRHRSGGPRWRGDGGRGQMGSYSGGEGGGYGRQDARSDRGQGGRGYGRQGEGPFHRGADQGRGGEPQRSYNRTFHNTNRGRVGGRGAQEENRDEGPKRYSTQRGPRTDPAPTSSSPTDIVYFDPSQQPPRGGPRAPPVRERKPLDIVPPSDPSA